jgi:CRISPR-associated protein Cas1
MIKLLNTLYISTQGAYLHKDGETIVVEIDGAKKHFPIHTIGGIVCFGNILVSPFLMGFCAERGVAISFLTEHGKFLASVRGTVNGNVLLRREQYRMADNEECSRNVAANIVRGKLYNSRVVLNRVLRDHENKVDADAIRQTSMRFDYFIKKISQATNIDEICGFEGEAAAEYFAVFNNLILEQKEDFLFTVRSRRPPLDEINAMLSFAYTILAHDIRSALESVGLDPQVGFLHKDRSGRHSLALDLMEEFRSVIADRLVLSLINRKQVNKKGFEKSAGGAVAMDNDTRKTLLTEWQNRKKEEVFHPYIEEKVQIGLLFFVQANLLARFIRGDIDGYPPFFWR